MSTCMRFYDKPYTVLVMSSHFRINSIYNYGILSYIFDCEDISKIVELDMLKQEPTIACTFFNELQLHILPILMVHQLFSSKSIL